LSKDGRAIACPELSDSQVEKLKERFGFPSGYQTSFLRGQIEDAAHLLFYPYQPILTAKQKLLRVRRIHKLANSLLAQLGRDGVDFPMIEPPGLRRLLFELRDAADQHAKNLEQKKPERGRKRESGIRSWALQLQHAFHLGTERIGECWWSDEHGKYCGELIEFLEAVAELSEISVSNGSIGTAIKEMREEKVLYGQESGV